MNDELPTSPLFDALAVWLMQQGLHEASVEDLAQGLGRRLVAGGIPISRLSIGGMVLHPVFGGMDVVWEADTDLVRSEMAPREMATTEVFQNAPFFQLTSTGIPFLRQKLNQAPAAREFPIYQRLRANHTTDYLAFFQTYGRTGEVLWADLPPGLEGVLGAFATRRIGGFSDLEIATLKALTMPLALAVKSTTTFGLARALLDVYLGRHTGRQVLNGRVERGDGQVIDCVLWFCDLRGSTALAEAMPLDDFLETLNEYFDCTAGAVLDHGGEVLKFIGDGVMAIFPVEAQTRPRIDMCRAALMAAREAISRVEQRNAGRLEADQPVIRFGISLHVGEVMYGNVGTRQRLDFTVIGSAANEAVRIEDLCKALGKPVAISKEFQQILPGGLVSLGVHTLAGKAQNLEIFTLPEFAEVDATGG